MRYALLILLSTITICCCKISISDTSNISVILSGDLQFRKTFASIQFITDEEERDKYVEQQEKSNPILLAQTDDSNLDILNRFEQLGLICQNTPDEYELLLSRFNFLTDTSFVYDISGIKYNLKFYTDNSGETTFFKLFSKTDSASIDTKSTPLQDLNYILLDIIPGGNKELVFLDDYYIMNGYNFGLKVYEIK